MTTITTILGGDNITDSRAVINTNFDNLNTDKQEILAEGPFVDGDKTKLDGIEDGAEVNNISDIDATNLTDGSNADSLHIHSASSTTYDDTISELGTTEVKSSLDELETRRLWASMGAIINPTLTDNLDGTVSIAGDGKYGYATDADLTTGKIVQLEATTASLNLVLTDSTVNYVYSDYNSGNPIYAVTTNRNDFLADFRKAPAFRIVREGNELHSLNYDSPGLALASKLGLKDIFLRGIERESGLTLSTAATRISTISDGVAWFSVEPYKLDENKAGITGELFEYYLTAGVWSSSLVTSYDNTYYSDGTDRQSLLPSKYVSKYFFRGVEDDNHSYYIHGEQFSSLASALEEPVPVAPSVVTAHSIYVGKIIIQEGAINGTAYPRIWDEALIINGVTNHDDLANINQAGIGITNGHISDGAQTIYGAKTYNTPIISSNLNITESTDKNYVTDAEQTAIGTIGDKVSLTGNETITGIKTFSSSPIVPAPTTDLQVANKKYVDDNAGGGGITEVFDVYMSASYSLTTTVTILQFNTETQDIGSNFDTTTFKFTAPSAGSYILNAELYYNGTTLGDNTQLYLVKNGGFTRTYTLAAPGLEGGFIGGQAILILAASDTIELRARNATAARGNMLGSNGRSHFSGYKID